MTENGITHVAVGFGASLITELDVALPPRSVLLVEDTGLVPDARERFLRHRCAAGVVHAPVRDEQAATDLAAAVTRPAGVVAAIPALEYGVVAGAALAEAWGLPGAGLGAARTLRDKALLREAADRAGLPQPQWRRADGPRALAAFRAEQGGWCVLKPSGRQASLGVQLLGPDADPDSAWAETAAAAEPDPRDGPAVPAPCLVEQLLQGPEVSVEALVSDGEVLFRNVTAKTVVAGRRPVELGHTVPAALPASVTARLDTVMDDLVAATGFRSGALHAEWILVGGEHPHLVECAGRLAGDAIPTLIDLAYGGSLVSGLVSVLDGRAERVRRDRRPRRGASVRFLTAAPGTVRSITGEARARAATGVLQVELTVAVGDRVRHVTSSWERSGLVIATGADAEQSAARADAAAAAVTIETEAAEC